MKLTFLIFIFFAAAVGGSRIAAQMPGRLPETISGGSGSGHQPPAPTAPAPNPDADEVAAALADDARIARFEKLAKYPGLSDKDFEFYKKHYAPDLKGVVIETDPVKRARLARLGAAVFRLHAVDRQCAVVLLDSRLPTVFTWKLTFVSLTTKDLEILTDEEITALIAHEVGHLYFTGDLLRARATGDDRLARVTELKCDLIALETLRRLKINEMNLITAVEKLIKARAALNVTSAEPGSPSMADRRRLAQILMPPPPENGK